MFSLPLLYKLRNQQQTDEPETSQPEEPDVPQESNPLSTTRDQLLKALGSVGHGKATSAYQSALSEQPKMEDYNPSTVQKVLGALGGFAGGFTGKDMNAGEKIIDAPYNRAAKQFQSKISGLKDSAALEHGQEIEQVKALGEEEGILHNQATENTQDKRYADAKATEERRYQQALRSADTAEQRAQETERHNRVMEGINQGKLDKAIAGGGGKPQVVEDQDLNINSPTFGQTRKTGRVIKEGESYGNKFADAEIQPVMAAKQVKEATAGIRDILSDPQVQNKVGTILHGNPGTWEQLKATLGAQDDHRLKELAARMDLLSGIHAKVLNMRGGPAAWSKLEKVFGNIGQDLPSFAGSLDAADANADEQISAKFPGQIYTPQSQKGKDNPGKAGTTMVTPKGIKVQVRY